MDGQKPQGKSFEILMSLASVMGPPGCHDLGTTGVV